MRKAIAYHRPVDHRAIDLKWPLWGLILFLLLPAGLWTYNEVNEAYWHRQYIKLGQAVDCQTRPFPKGLSCNPRIDGIDCDEGDRNWLREWHEPIDFACAQFGPEPVFVFSTYRDLNLDAETIALMREALDYVPEPETREVQDITG